MKDFSKATERPWQQGQLLMTRSVRHWTQESRDKQNAEERLMVFSNFTPEDEGRSRRLIAICSHPEDAELIVTAVNNFDKMKEAIETQLQIIEALIGSKRIVNLDESIAYYKQLIESLK